MKGPRCPDAMCPACGFDRPQADGIFCLHSYLGKPCAWSARHIPHPVKLCELSYHQQQKEARRSSWHERKAAYEALSDPPIAFGAPAAPPKEDKYRRGASAEVCPSGKIVYINEAAGEDAAMWTTRSNLQRLRSNGRTAARSYKCPRCCGWHVTSKATP